MKDGFLVVNVRGRGTKVPKEGLDADLTKFWAVSTVTWHINSQSNENDGHSGQTMAMRHEQKVKRE